MSDPITDRNLLFGILAVQNAFVTQERLVAAMSAWALDKSRPLGQLLVERGDVTEAENASLAELLAQHLARHHGDPQQSLTAMKSPGAAVPLAPVREALRQVPDTDLQASLDGTLCRASGQDTNAAGNAAPTSGARPAAPRFSILRPHARGGLGQVFVALDEELHREVALKEIQLQHADDPESRARFVLEAEITGRLEHPGIVPVYGLGLYADGRPFYAMRFIRGDSLKDAIARFHQAEARGRDPGARQVELRQLLGRFVDVCNAIAYAHSRGVLHRDLKPANVMLGQYGETLVVDWGLAKVLGKAEAEAEAGRTEGALAPATASGSAPTQMGRAMGTPAYMSPEQAAGRLDRLGPASDVYSLGATLYHLLTGKAPFEDEDVGSVLQKLQRGDFAPPRQVNRQAPPALEAICLKAMALEPEQRYASARALTADVERWLADEPVSAHRESLPARVRRWMRRHRALVTGGAALLMTAVVALAVSTLLIGDALRGEERARKDRALAQVDALLTANARAVPNIIDNLKTTRADVLPRLRELWAQDDSRETRTGRMRAALALLALDGAAVTEPLRAWMLQAEDPQEMLLVRDALRPHGDALAAPLWKTVDGAKTAPAERFRALVALAAFDPGNGRWRVARTAVVEEFLSANPLHLGLWAEALRPVRGELLAPLGDVFHGRALAEKRQVAAEVLADYTRDRPEILTDLLAEADPRQWQALLPRLKAHRERAVALLLAELGKVATPDWKDPPIDPAWKAPAPALVAKVEKAEGLVAERFALCQTLPLADFKDLAAGLRRCGYRPVRLRPFLSGDTVRVAAVWTRDGREWRMVQDLSAEEIHQRDVEARGQGMVAVDVAGYLPKIAGQAAGATRYGALWATAIDKGEQTGIYLGAEYARHTAAYEPYKNEGFVPHTVQAFPGPDGQRLYSGVWGKSKPAPADWNVSWDLAEQAYLDQFFPARNLQADIAVSSAASPAGPATRYAAVWHGSAAFASEELHGLTPEAHRKRCGELVARGYRPTAIAVAWLEEGKPLTAASVWHRPIVPDTVKDALASRQAQAAVALAQLGHAAAVWPLLKHTPDPSRRTYLIHALGRLKSDPEAILERLALGAKLDVSERRALILSLGEFTARQLPANKRGKLVPTLLQWYRDDPDPGIHSAIDWLLRHGKQGLAARKLNWDQAAALRKLDAELAGNEPGKRDWYVTAKEGHTFALIRKPAVFLMGSPLHEADRFSSEIPHRRRIDRAFAIATKEVTVAQFQRFLEANPEFKRRHSYLKKYSPEDDGPQVTVTWYEAAAYCNWLSTREGIPEEQWVYPKDPAAIEEGMVLAKGHLEKTGYRLPTEAEWEYACRAGASSSRFYGSAEGLLGEYAWYPNNSGDQAWPGGQLKPNDLGQFDIYGNALEWSQDRYLPYPGGRMVYGDSEDIKYNVDDTDSWGLRGGSFDYQAPYVRSANRNYRRPSSRLNSVGLRPARTYR